MLRSYAADAAAKKVHQIPVWLGLTVKENKKVLPSLAEFVAYFA
jgi:hypothetical protein